MKSKQFLEEIRTSAGLARAVLKRIEVKGEKVTFYLITDLTYGAEDVAHANAVCARYVPEGFTGEANVMKSVPDAEGIRRFIADFLGKRFPSVAAFVRPDDIEAVKSGSGGTFYIGADENDRARLAADGAIDALNDALQRSFCGTWFGEFRFTQREKGEIEREIPPEERVFAPRFFPIENYDPIDDGAPTRAIYIADLEKEMQGITVCGTLSYIEERTTKTGKPYFSFTLSDGTGSMRCSYFTRSATLEKVRDLRAGNSVCLTGDNELFNGAFSFRAKKVDRGSPPEGFVPETRPSRPVPAQYRAVFPSPASDLVQGNLFGESGLPADLTEGKFVVFDIETTGLGSVPSAGGMDRIIELGAVKIERGAISEKFSTFVSCPVKLSDEIVNLTGITDEMLVGAPDIADVIADFYRFCDGCALVGHNALGFDIRFIRYYGEKEGYLFGHKVYDTLLIAQRELHFLPNHKLNTLADYFEFTFRHHRAYDDAFVTAKIFMELVKRRGGLPA